MKFLAMKFQEKQKEWFTRRGIGWHVSSIVVSYWRREPRSNLLHTFLIAVKEWFSVLSVLKNLSHGQHSFTYYGCKLWKCISSDFKAAASVNSFRHHLAQKLLGSAHLC